MHHNRNNMLLTGASALALMLPAAAFAAPVTYNISTDTLSNDNNTTLSSPIATTNGLENQGALLTGSSNATTYRWNFTGADLTVAAGGTPGFASDVSGGSTIITFDNTDVVGNNEAGIKITTSNLTSTTLNINNGSTVTGGAAGGTAAGIYIDSSSTRRTNLSIDSTSSVTNGGGAAAIDVVNTRSSGNSLFSNAGTVSGGAAGHGVYLRQTAFLHTFTNQASGTITGGATGTSHGMQIESNSAIFGSFGLRNFNNFGTITGGATAGDGLAIRGTGEINNFNNNGDITGGGGNSSGLSMDGGSTNIVTLNNNTSGTITGGAGNAYGMVLSNNALVNTLNNSGSIEGANTAGGGIYVRATSRINTLNNLATGTINTDGSGAGYGVLVQGDNPGDNAVITALDNQGTIAGNTVAAIGLLGGDNLAGNTFVTTNLLNNQSTGTIESTGGGHGVQVGNLHILTELRNQGSISGDGATGNGVRVSGNGLITNLNNGLSTADAATALIAGSGTATGGSGVLVASGDARIETVSNYGVISSRLGADSAGGDGIRLTLGSMGNIENRGVIKGGTATGRGVSVNTLAQIDTINNYDGGVISGGQHAIELSNAAYSTAINSAGAITGDVQLGSTAGTGDTVSIYGGTVTGDILGADASGNFGTVNFNLVGGTFGTGGASAGTAFDTAGDIGQAANRLLAANVNSGTLTLNDDVHATTTTIANGATVNVNGLRTIGGTLVNNGTLSLGTERLTVTNGFSGTGSLRLAIDAGTGGSHGHIVSGGGAVNLTQMTVVPLYSQGAIAPRERLVLVKNPGSLTFNALNMQSRHGVRWTLSEALTAGTDYQGIAYGAGSLLAVANSISSGVSPVNAGGVNALSDYAGANADILALQAGLTSDVDHNRAGAQLRPDASGGGVLAALNASEQAQDSITTHLQGSGLSSGETLTGGNVWAHGFGSRAHQGRMKGVDGFDATSQGATFGADREVQPDLRLGGAFTYADSDVDDAGSRKGSGEEIDSYIGNIYGRYTADSWYAHGALTAGLHQYDTQRLVNFTGNTLVYGEFDSRQYGARGEVGLPLAAGRFTLTPFAGFAADLLQQDGYAETGAGGAGLVVGDSDIHSWRGTLGTSLTTVETLDNGWQLQPSLRLGFRHEFNDSLIASQNVNFIGGGASFTTPGLELPRNSGLLGFDVDLTSAAGFATTLRYDAEYNGDYANQSVHLRGRYAF